MLKLSTKIQNRVLGNVSYVDTILAFDKNESLNVLAGRLSNRSSNNNIFEIWI